MVKRKLDVHDAPQDLCRNLAREPGVGLRLAQRLVSALRADGQGKRTCSRQSQRFRDVMDLVTAIDVPSPKPLSVDMALVGPLVQRKMEACPLYRCMMEQAMGQREGRVTLVLFSDEAQTGNVLGARQSRKCNLAFFAFLEMPALHLDALWLPFAAMLASSVKQAGATYVAVLRALLEATRREVEVGFPVDVAGEPKLLFIEKVILLGDHEGLRSLSGCKGASGFKPCLKCTNVLAKGKTGPVGYVGIACADAARFSPQTDSGLRETLRYLKGCRNKKALQESETLLGWSAAALAVSPLASTELEGWLCLDALYFDQMHELWSNGVVAQELGLWYTALLGTGWDLGGLRRLEIGWKATETGAVKKAKNLAATCFADAMWKPGQDYRGDASACLTALPLCVAFSLEMLLTYAAMQRPIDSLRKLYACTSKILAAKADVSQVKGLQARQAEHVRAFVLAYGEESVRPKLHYALHVPAQAARWGRVLDCFVGERKHRRFKSEYGPRLRHVAQLPRSALLHQLQAELDTISFEEQWTGRLLGNPTQCPLRAESLGLPSSATFALGVEYHAVAYRRGTYVVLSDSLAVRVAGAVEALQDLWLIVECLHPSSSAGHVPWPTWQRGDGKFKLLPAREISPREPARLAREGNSIWLLR